MNTLYCKCCRYIADLLSILYYYYNCNIRNDLCCILCVYFLVLPASAMPLPSLPLEWWDLIQLAHRRSRGGHRTWQPASRRARREQQYICDRAQIATHHCGLETYAMVTSDGTTLKSAIDVSPTTTDWEEAANPRRERHKLNTHYAINKSDN